LKNFRILEHSFISLKELYDSMKTVTTMKKKMHTHEEDDSLLVQLKASFEDICHGRIKKI